MNINNLKIKRTEQIKRMQAINAQLSGEGLTEEYRSQIQAEWDTLNGEVEDLDSQIKRAERQDSLNQSLLDEPSNEPTNPTEPVVRSTKQPITKRKVSQFNIAEALRAVADKELTPLMQRMNESVGISSDGILISPQFTRAGEGTLTTTTGETIVEETIHSDLDIIVPEPIYKKLGCRVLPGLVGNVGLPVQDHNEAKWADEGATLEKPENRPAKPVLKPVRVGITDSVSKEFLASSNPALYSAMISDMVAGIDTAMTRRVFKRIKENSSIADLNPDGSTATAISAEVITAMEAAIEPDGKFVMHRSIFGSGKSTPTNEGATKMLIEGKNTGGTTYDGYKAYGSNLAGGDKEDSTLYYGDFRTVTIGLWGGIEILVNPYSKMADGEVLITVNRIADIQIRNAKAFVKYSKMKA